MVKFSACKVVNASFRKEVSPKKVTKDFVHPFVDDRVVTFAGPSKLRARETHIYEVASINYIKKNSGPRSTNGITPKFVLLIKKAIEVSNAEPRFIIAIR